MGEISKDALEKIKAQLISDYYTPTYRFEVAFDTLITPYIDEIVNNCTYKDGNKVQLYTEFVAKEMCLPRENKKDDEKWFNRKNGAHIDYVLADENSVYMVELKTSKNSVKEEQIKRYDQYLGKTYGKVLGEHLVKLLWKKYENLLSAKSEYMKVHKKEPDIDNNKKFIELLEVLLKKCKNKLNNTNQNTLKHTDTAIRYLKQENKTSTYKYLYTAAQILDYFDQSPNSKIWELKLKLIYITPYGNEEDYIRSKLDNSSDFAGILRLVDAAPFLYQKTDDKLSKMLAQTIKSIYIKND